MRKLYRLAVFLGLILFLSFFYFSYSSKISLLDKNFFAQYVKILFNNSIIKDNFTQLNKTIYFLLNMFIFFYLCILSIKKSSKALTGSKS